MFTSSYPLLLPTKSPTSDSIGDCISPRPNSNLDANFWRCVKRSLYYFTNCHLFGNSVRVSVEGYFCVVRDIKRMINWPLRIFFGLKSMVWILSMTNYFDWLLGIETAHMICTDKYALKQKLETKTNSIETLPKKK